MLVTILEERYYDFQDASRREIDLEIIRVTLLRSHSYKAAQTGSGDHVQRITEGPYGQEIPRPRQTCGITTCLEIISKAPYVIIKHTLALRKSRFWLVEWVGWNRGSSWCLRIQEMEVSRIM